MEGLSLPAGQLAYLRAQGFYSDGRASVSIQESIRQFCLSEDIHPVSRIFGSNRYTTAVEVSRAGWPGGADTVLLVRGDRAALPESL